MATNVLREENGLQGIIKSCLEFCISIFFISSIAFENANTIQMSEHATYELDGSKADGRYVTVKDILPDKTPTVEKLHV